MPSSSPRFTCCVGLRAVSFFGFLLCLLAPRSTPAQTAVTIHQIMTSLPNSPLLGQNVTTSGIVVGVMTSATTGTNGGFYISLATYDSDVNTAEGIFVAASAVAACNTVTVGQVATVTGIVTNSVAPNLTAANTPGTYIAPTACSTSGTSSMTQTISVSGVLTTFGDALKYTGMAVSNTSFYAVQPTTGTLASGANAVTSTGQFWATLNTNSGTNNHLFRSAGIGGDEYRPTTAPAGVPTWSGNPQRVLIDTASFGGSPVDITVGQAVTCTNHNTSGLGATNGIGVVDYTLGYARILIFNTVTCTVSGSVPTSVSAAADTTHFKVGTLDVNTFLGSASVFQTALAKATLAVTNVFGSPDILALQEVGDQSTLQYLAAAANTVNGGSTNYVATVLGTDTINSGFLVNTNTLKSSSYTEVGRGVTYATSSGGTATLWEHPPLVLQGEFVRVGKNYPVTVLDVHMTPRENIDDATLGPDVRAHRAAQASAISTLVQQYQSAGANVIVAGNLNGYEYNDGYVDVTGIIDGAPAAATAVTLYQASNTTAPLHDFTTDVTANTRYNIIERGNAAALEHIFASATVTDSSTASASLASYVNTVTQPHFSTDYSAVSANDATTPAGLTPHDGFLVNFAIPPVPTTASITPSSLNFGDVVLGASKSLTATVTNTTTFTSTVNITNIAISGASATDFSQTSTCTSLSMGSTCTVTVTFKPTATGTRTATLTVTTDSTSNATLTVALSGNGLATTATLTPAAANFGNVVLGSTSAAQTFVWMNTSTVPLTVSSVTVTGDYSISATTCSGAVAAGTVCSVSVVFKPTVLKTRTGVLTVVSDSSANGTLTASLTGNGIADVQADVDALNFGNVDVGFSSAAQTVTITNYTTTAIALTGVSISGDYRETTTCGGTLSGGASCAVSIIFTPTTTGVRTGALVVTTNDTRYPVIIVALTGNGVDFSVRVTPTTGSTIAGYNYTDAKVTVTAIGGFSAPVTLTCTTKALGSACSLAPSGFTLSGTTVSAATITTTSKYTVIGYGALLFQSGRGRWMTLLGLLSATALCMARGRGRQAARLLLTLVFLGLAAGAMSGCSGKLPALNSPYTEPGTYDYVFTVTDGQLSHTATLSLTVTAK
ncbi:choice-of-anchor D domain-containing protein [Terriglobus roseus]|uniref:Uncharacterized protein n=1 Tax=Terriglobus roseus TaxID=392734 RepID=A0A1H4LH58_9BACT|nr:choice-of-anchor D domain-containing protein [Terriglobus roseus]SEB69622.1 hypothetical protein SAMN05443244_1584 [Terriglobus roseus]